MLHKAFHVSTSSKVWKLLGFPNISTHLTLCIFSSYLLVEIFGKPENFHSITSNFSWDSRIFPLTSHCAYFHLMFQWKFQGNQKFSTLSHHISQNFPLYHFQVNKQRCSVTQSVSREYFIKSVEIIGIPEYFHSPHIVHIFM